MNKRRPFVVGISGSTCTGKTTVARKLERLLNRSNTPTVLIEQDGYYQNDLSYVRLANLDYWNFDVIESIDVDKMLQILQSHVDANQPPSVVIVEGHLIYASERLYELFDLRINFTISLEECRYRRQLRTYDPPDVTGYFEQYVWPQYEQRLQQYMEKKEDFLWLESDGQGVTDIFAKTVAAVMKRVSNDWIMFTEEDLCTQCALEYVKDDSNGAVALFAGTVRDKAYGKKVMHLNYEAYESMAYENLHKICQHIRQRWPSIANIAVFHRTGKVSVNGTSLVVSMGAPHRAEPLAALPALIDLIKDQTPIWKEEVYSDGSSLWVGGVERNGNKTERVTDEK